LEIRENNILVRVDIHITLIVISCKQEIRGITINNTVKLLETLSRLGFLLLLTTPLGAILAIVLVDRNETEEHHPVYSIHHYLLMLQAVSMN